MSQEIQTIGIVTLIEEKLGLTMEDTLKMSFEEESKLIRDWCEENNFHYYAAPKENFFKWKGIQEAEQLGKVGVVLENLS
jgi:hypothetical protein